MKNRDEIEGSIEKAKKIPLKKLDLEGKDLSNLDLSGVDLSGSNLSGSVIVGSDFSGSDLSGADLSNSRISQSDFSYTNTYKTNFKNSYLTGSVNLMQSYSGNQPMYSGHREDTWSYGEVEIEHEHADMADESVDQKMSVGAKYTP